MSAAADSGGAACDAVSAADSGGVPGALVELPAVLPPAPRTFGDGAIELRVGRWQEALADVASVDVLIVDAPYSARTHSAYREMQSMRRRSIDYDAMSPSDVDSFVQAWAPRVQGWIVTITDHVLAPVWCDALAAAGRYVFAPLAALEPGSRVRLTGDGPTQWSVWIVVARPKTREFQRWGSLAGGYVVPQREKRVNRSNAGDGQPVIGGKPLWLMQALIRDYSRPGDLICDPCAGGATTLLAAAIEGRRAIGAEMDPATYALACKRLGRGYTPNMFTARDDRTRAAATQHDLDLGITTTR